MVCKFIASTKVIKLSSFNSKLYFNLIYLYVYRYLQRFENCYNIQPTVAEENKVKGIRMLPNISNN